MYKFNLTLRNSDNVLGSWWLNRLLYTAGPSLLLLLRSQKTEPDSIYDKVVALKGPSNPYEGAPGQIRFDLFGTNRALNLLHASDDVYSMVREYLLFSNIDRLKSVLDEIASTVQLGNQRVEALHTLNKIKAMAFFQSAATVSVDTNLFRNSFRLILKSLLTDSDKRCENSRAMLQYFTRMVPQISEMDVAKNISIMDQVVTVLSDSKRPLDLPIEGRQAATQLANINSYSDASARLILDQLDFVGCHVSPWEKLILMSSAHNLKDIVGSQHHR